jgi:hypothetical protein
LGAALDVDVSAFAEPAATHTSLGAYSAELMRRLNSQVAELDTLRYRTGFHKALARSVLAQRAGSEPRIGLAAEHHDWVVRRADRLVADIAALDIHVIGDLDELVPEPNAQDLGGFDPAAASDAELLSAALDGLAGVTQRLADVQIACDELRRRDRSDG